MGTFDLVSRVLFPSPESSYTIDDFPEELIWVPRSLDPSDASPEDCIPCLFLPSPSARFLVYYLHSNAEDLRRCYPFCALLRYQFQVMWVICCMLPYMVGIVRLRPWRHLSSYTTDLASAVLLSITVSLMASFAEKEPERESDYAAIILGFSFIPALVFFYYVITVGCGLVQSHVQSHRGRGDLQAELVFSYQLKGMLSVIGGASPEPFAKFVSKLADTELESLRTVHDLILLQFFGLQAHTEWWKQSISLSAGMQESGVRWRHTTFDGIAATSPAGGRVPAAIKDRDVTPEDAEANTRDALTKRLCGMRAMKEIETDVTDFPGSENVESDEQLQRNVLSEADELALGPVSV